MLTRPAFVGLSKDDRVRILKDVFMGLVAVVPRELQFDDGSSVLRKDWARWQQESSLSGTLKRLSPAEFSDVLFCLMSCAGLVVVSELSSHDVVTTGLAYVNLTLGDVPAKGRASFVEVSSPLRDPR